MMSPSLVMMCMSRYSEWSRGVVNRNRHMFEACVASGRFEKILLVDFPARNPVRGLRVYFKDILFGRCGRTVQRGATWRLTKVSETVWVFASVEHLFSRSAFFQTVKKVQALLGIERPFLWSYVPTLPECFDEIENSSSLFDAVDDWTVHPAYAAMRETLKKHYETIRQKAQYITTVSRHLLGLFPDRERVLWVPNGVDVDHFRVRTKRTPERPTLAYVGMIQERFDVCLVEQLARARPNYDFLIIGWVWKSINVDQLWKLPNVRLTGFIPYDKLPRFLEQCSVGLIPHKRDGLTRSMNPLKLYDYLAAGLPVVTSVQPDFRELSGITEAKTAEEFLAALDQYVENPPDPETLRKQVEPFSWQNRLNTILEYVTIEQHAESRRG